MAINVGKQPQQCPHPECESESGFTFRNVRYQYDTRHEMGTLQAQQIPRCRITRWECDRCHSLIDVVHDL